jgi:hypothetical protein
VSNDLLTTPPFSRQEDAAARLNGLSPPHNIRRRGFELMKTTIGGVTCSGSVQKCRRPSHLVNPDAAAQAVHLRRRAAVLRRAA